MGTRNYMRPKKMFLDEKMVENNLVIVLYFTLYHTTWGFFHKKGNIFPALDFGLGYMTCLGQWDINRCDSSRNLICAVGLGNSRGTRRLKKIFWFVLNVPKTDAQE